MKSVGTLRKKGLVVDHFVHRKDKVKQNPPLANKPVQEQQQQQQQQKPTVNTMPITVDLHRFADDNLQPEECKNE
ncbi:hypothetical protein G6F36_015157 [Rhizopus arrhizus]|nr:hypothetical protein G6F36_015157 [Rhizopus arrhizus]